VDHLKKALCVCVVDIYVVLAAFPQEDTVFVVGAF
jgi:hypothetical protein